MDLKNKATERLRKELNTLNIGTGLLIGMILLLVCLSTFRIWQGLPDATCDPEITIPLALSSIVFAELAIIRRMQGELKLREQTALPTHL